MLPQIKRPQRSDDGDVEIEVVDVRNVDGSEISDDDPTMLAQNTLFPKGGAKNGTSSSRPPASAAANVSLGNLTNKRPSRKAEAFGDEPTRLMPSKHGGKSSVPPPPASARAISSRPPAAPPSVRPGALPPSSPPPALDARQGVPLPNSSLVKGTAGEFRPPVVPSSRRHAPPAAFRDREESKTMLRPLGALSENAQQDAKVSIAVPSAGAIKAQVDAARAKRMADQRARAAETLEVTPVSISERFVVQGRPAAPWAVAFVAMGIFAGLATAVFTGGHASSISAFIDPARLAIAAAAGQPAAPAAAANAQAPAQPASDPAANMATTTTMPAPAAVDPALDLAPTTPTSVFAVGHATAKAPDTTPAPTPVAHAAPKADTPKPTPVAKADPPAAKADPTPVAKADPKPAPAADKSSDSSSHASKPSKGKHGGGGDVDSAAAADALAKAQLENSL